MRLPNIESIYVRNHESTDGDETDYTHTDWLPPKCSSLKHLWLDNAGNLNGSRWSPVLFGAPCELLTVSFRRGDATLNDADTIVNDLNKYQGNSLQILMFYDYEDAVSHNYRQGGISGYDCCAFLPESYGVCNALKHVCINIQDIELNASQGEYEGWEDEYSTEGEEDANEDGGDENEASDAENEDSEDPNAPDHDNYDAEDSSTTAINSTFPRSFATPFSLRAFPYQIETLVLWGQPSNAYISWSPAVAVDDALTPTADAHTMVVFEEAIITLIKREPNLKAIYLGNTERGHDEPRTERILYQEAVSVGRKYGVDVHTGANREVLRVAVDGERVGEGWWREAPDKYDWKTGPWGQRPRDWRFDVYTGRRGPEGCGKCGECEACLGLYSRELWETIG